MGITFGFPFMVFCVSLGLGALFQQSVFLRNAVPIVGLFVLLWFAWKVATAGRFTVDERALKPMTFLQSAAFQWVNPKALAMTTSISSQYSDPNAPIISALIIAGVFVLAGFTSASAWTLFGQMMRRLLQTDRAALVFNITMAGLLLFSVAIIILSSYF